MGVGAMSAWLLSGVLLSVSFAPRGPVPGICYGSLQTLELSAQSQSWGKMPQVVMTFAGQ